MKPNQKNRVIVGMSGGVDSSVAALLLKQQGYDVQGLFMKNWEDDDDDKHCSASVDVADARAICDRIDIPLHTVNFAKEYWENVFAHFLQEYQAGRTPNPDILCNKEIKFKAFLDHAKQLGADFIATGHYVQNQSQNNQYQLLKGMDSDKDQSYFLYTLTQNQLQQTLFPLGTFKKPQIRLLAEEAGFINHAKKGSTGICFIGERHFKTFLKQYLPAKPGAIETVTGHVLGQHDGLMYHTLGQRQGLGIGGQKGEKEGAWYVLKKDLSRNVLVVGQDPKHPLLLSKTLIAEQLHWIQGENPIVPVECSAKVRYRQPDQMCVLTPIADHQYHVSFNEPQWAVTPGQSVVFYQKEHCLGGGIIVSK